MMRLRAAYLVLSLPVTSPAQQAFAQQAGLWEVQTAIDGAPVGAPVHECRVAGAQVTVLQTWPTNCVAMPLRRTASGMMTEARCAAGSGGASLLLTRKLTGDLNHRYEVVTTSLISGASPVQASHRSTVTFRYLGPCAGHASFEAQAAAGSHSSREPVPIMLLRILALVLVFGSIAITGLFFRRRWRSQRDRATVANIVTDTAGIASIPVLVTFTGVRGLPWWYGIAMNNARPLLAIEPDGIRLRVVRQQRRSFDEIACVDVRQGPGTVNLDFKFYGSLFTFAANVGTVALAAHVIASLPPSVPLSTRAQAVRATL